MTITEEGGGFIVTCACGWLRYDPTRPGIRAVEAAHQKKCKKASEPLATKPFWGALRERIGTGNVSGLGAVAAALPALTDREGIG